MSSHNFPVITGMGAYCAGGENLPLLWKNLLDKRIHLSFQQLKKSALQVPVYAAKTPRFSGNSQRLVHRADRSVALALAAAQEAWQASGLNSSCYEPSRIGVIIGSSRGPAAFHEQNILKEIKSPSSPVYGTFSSVAGIVSDVLCVEGSALMVSSTCTSSASALHLAGQMIRSGELDAVVVGGVDAPLVDFILEQYVAARVLSQNNKLSPFDRDRSGTLLGEGAAFIILESKKFAERRNAVILAELGGVVLRSYPGQRGSLDHEGASLQKVMAFLLQQAQLFSNEIDLLHLHGTGTRLNDLIESRAVEAIFGKPLDQPIAWATKAITGHTLGASSLFQVVLSVQSLIHSHISETVNCEDLDPACSLRLHHGAPIMQPIKNALCLTSGFWGNVAGIVLKKVEGLRG
ncbi:MAG: beta-ketoacyl synthase N-terminal-like domain-containing protein [Chthoniobacterales bacterium]